MRKKMANNVLVPPFFLLKVSVPATSLLIEIEVCLLKCCYMYCAKFEYHFQVAAIVSVFLHS